MKNSTFAIYLEYVYENKILIWFLDIAFSRRMLGTSEHYLF